MKLRLKNNSVRLRLTQNDLAIFRSAGRVEEAIEFGIGEPQQRFVYRLESDAQTKTPRAILENGGITIFVPSAQADEWANTERVGVQFEQEIGAGKTLRLLVEKDFACLEPRAGEDDADAFPYSPGAKNR